MDGAPGTEQNKLPIAYTGVWQRQSLAIAGRAPFEDSDVIWLQTRSYFADLRTPRCMHRATARVSAFSGSIRWQAPRISFVHDLDLANASADDSAELQLAVESEDFLIERGVRRHGTQLIEYQETWRRMRKPDGMTRVVDGRLPTDQQPSMRFIEIAGIALLLLDERHRGGDFTAVQFARDGGDWRAMRQVGSSAILPPPPALQDTTWMRRTWVVRECCNDASAATG
jgi:hypothetical protein